MGEQSMRTVASHVSRGDALRETGQLDMAKAEYQTALRLDPKAAGAALGLWSSKSAAAVIPKTSLLL